MYKRYLMESVRMNNAKGKPITVNDVARINQNIELKTQIDDAKNCVNEAIDNFFKWYGASSSAEYNYLLPSWKLYRVPMEQYQYIVNFDSTHTKFDITVPIFFDFNVIDKNFNPFVDSVKSEFSIDAFSLNTYLQFDNMYELYDIRVPGQIENFETVNKYFFRNVPNKISKQLKNKCPAFNKLSFVIIETNGTSSQNSKYFKNYNFGDCSFLVPLSQGNTPSIEFLNALQEELKFLSNFINFDLHKPIKQLCFDFGVEDLCNIDYDMPDIISHTAATLKKYGMSTNGISFTLNSNSDETNDAIYAFFDTKYNSASTPDNNTNISDDDDLYEGVPFTLAFHDNDTSVVSNLANLNLEQMFNTQKSTEFFIEFNANVVKTYICRQMLINNYNIELFGATQENECHEILNVINSGLSHGETIFVYYPVTGSYKTR